MEAVDIQTSPDPQLVIDPAILEELKALFLADDFLREAPRKLYRVDGKERRYYHVDEAGIHWFLGTTSAIDAALRQSPHIVKWIADTGWDESQKIKNDKAEYGTFMHAQIAEFLIAKTYDLDRAEEIVKGWEDLHSPEADTSGWAELLRNDLPAFAQFAHDYKLKPLAIELVLASDELGIAGAIDLVAKITIEEDGVSESEVYKSGPRKGQPKEIKVEREILAMIDFKSGRKGFFEAHEIQLHAYRAIWDENFPDMPVEQVRNWAPMEWRKRPTYKFEDQTNKLSRFKLPHLLALALQDVPVKPAIRTETIGVLTLGEDPSENVREIDIEALILGSFKEKENVTDQTTAAA